MYNGVVFFKTNLWTNSYSTEIYLCDIASQVCCPACRGSTLLALTHDVPVIRRIGNLPWYNSKHLELT